MVLSKVKITSALAALALALSLHGAANAGTTSYKYDALGRVIQVNYPDGAEIKYTYDAAGNRTQVLSTASPSSSTVKVVVLPLLGGVVIPVD